MKYFFQTMVRKDLIFKKLHSILSGLLFLVISNLLTGQTIHDTLPSNVTLSQCIGYALANQSLIKQSLLDEDINKSNIRIALSGWYPQLELDANVPWKFWLQKTEYRCIKSG